MIDLNEGYIFSPREREERLEQSETMEAVQKLNRDTLLRWLVESCGNRFIRAAELVDLEYSYIRDLTKRFVGGYYVWDLYPAYDVIARRFLREANWAQIDAFRNDDCRAIWCTRFFCDWLIPKLREEDEICRNVLRANGMLPVRDKQKALDALIVGLEEITLPGSAPSWFRPIT